MTHIYDLLLHHRRKSQLKCTLLSLFTKEEERTFQPWLVPMLLHSNKIILQRPASVSSSMYFQVEKQLLQTLYYLMWATISE